MTEDEAKSKICPYLKTKCVGSECMAWKWKRKILPFHINLSNELQKRYKGIEIIAYDGMQIITVLGGDCVLLEKDRNRS